MKSHSLLTACQRHQSKCGVIKSLRHSLSLSLLQRSIPLPTSRVAFSSSSSPYSSAKEPFYGSPRPLTQSSTNDWKSAATQFLEQASSALPPRAALTLEHAVIALRDPTRADAVAAVGELTGTQALEKLRAVLQQEAPQLLHARPIVSKATIPYEQLLQQGQDTLDLPYTQLTFGQAYGRFLHTHGFDPDERDPIQFIDDPELAYIMLRYRQSHDFYHTLTGLPPTVLGEVALKWLELWQTGLPMTAMAGTFASFVTLSWKEQLVLHQYYIPWAHRVGGDQMRFGSLLTVEYEREWDTPLVDLQQRLGVELAPRIPGQDQSTFPGKV